MNFEFYNCQINSAAAFCNVVPDGLQRTSAQLFCTTKPPE